MAETKKLRLVPEGFVPGNPGNSGGKPGRSGRRPKVWNEFCGKALRDPEVQKKALELAKRGDVQMLKLMVESAQGLPGQKIILKSDEDALDGLFARLRPKTVVDTTITGVN